MGRALLRAAIYSWVAMSGREVQHDQSENCRASSSCFAGRILEVLIMTPKSFGRARMQRYLTGCIAAFIISLAPVHAARARVQVGIAVPLTGPHTWAGEETRAGAEAAVQDLNRRGGVLGEALIPVLVDDFCDPQQA